MKKHLAEKGETLQAAADAYFEFNCGLIDALCDVVPAIKPQSAYYELLGHAGVEALKKTADYGRSKGLYVIADVKRNDIGSTATAYSEAYLGSVKIGNSELFPFNFDAATVNAYLGSDGILPFIEHVCPARQGNLRPRKNLQSVVSGTAGTLSPATGRSVRPSATSSPACPGIP